MWTSGDDTTSDLFTKNIDKRMCMLYKHMVEKLLWIIEVKRVDLTAEVSIKLKTTNGPQFDPDDWIEFKAGTEECLASIQGNTRVPLKEHACIQSFRYS